MNNLFRRKFSSFDKVRQMKEEKIIQTRYLKNYAMKRKQTKKWGDEIQLKGRVN